MKIIKIIVLVILTIILSLPLMFGGLGLSDPNLPNLGGRSETCDSGDYAYSVDFRKKEIECREDQVGAGGGNPFDQSLNTTDSVNFSIVNVDTEYRKSGILILDQFGSTGLETLLIGDAGDGSISTKSIYIGQDAGKDSLNPSNIGIGRRTLQGQDDPLGTGQNIAIGEDALRAGDGIENVAIGYQAMSLNGNGCEGNVALGKSALRDCFGGTLNFAMGDESMFELTSGRENMGVGANTLHECTICLRQTAVGTNSLYANVDGAYNVGLGYQSLRLNSNGDRNFAAGRQAGYTTQGDDSIFIGYRSGRFIDASDKLHIDITDRNDSLIEGNFNTRWIMINGDLKNPDDEFYYQGDSDDVSSSFNGSDWVFNAEVGTPNLYYIGFPTIDMDNDLNVQNNITGNIIYGDMHFHNDTEGNVTVISSSDTWYNITAFGGQGLTGTLLNGFSKTGDALVSQIAGNYKADYCISSSGTANNKYHIVVAIDSVPQLMTEQHHRISGGADVINTCGTGFLSGTSIGDEFTLMVLNEDAGNDITIFSANLNLLRIGGSL
jgi:hypothetical protein